VPLAASSVAAGARLSLAGMVGVVIAVGSALADALPATTAAC
jgi:hypothetical protein